MAAEAGQATILAAGTRLALEARTCITTGLGQGTPPGTALAEAMAEGWGPAAPGMAGTKLDGGLATDSVERPQMER